MTGREPDCPETSRRARLALVRLFSARMRRWRKSQRIPLKQVASELGVSISVVSAWENGDRFPSATHLARLSAYTGLPVCQLIYHWPGDCPNCQRNSKARP